MDKHLPLFIDPSEFCRQHKSLEGILELASMTRLVNSLVEKEGKVEIKLEFGIDKGGVSYICGKISTEVVFNCQRCLEPFKYTLVASVSLSPVKSDKVEAHAPYEPLLLDDKPLSLAAMVEDELILAIPIVPKHEIQECKVKENQDFTGE